MAKLTWEFPPYTKTIHRSGYPAINPTNPSNSAAGKVVLVTGGGGGIGKAIAEAYNKAGAKAIAILGRRENLLREAAAELEKAGDAKILYFAADVLDEAALKAAFAAVAKEVGAIDVVVANHGYMATPEPAASSDVGDWWKSYEINIKGTFLTFRAWLPHKSANSPTFISLNTAAAHMGIFPGFSAYSPSEMARGHLASHLQAEHPDIRVVSFHPGVLETDMGVKSGMPMSRDDMSLPSGFAVWLASPAADWVVGRFLWANWDVEELAQMKNEIVKNNELTFGVLGWPKQVEATIVA
ncbi:hypothetical protein LTR85_010764 [Meristemomyces frigidus]|nr:hypothetical protein LTR85_010764 [Meristemomyces frigidus]